MRNTSPLNSSLTEVNVVVYRRGKRHSLDGPAVRQTYLLGDKITHVEQYWRNGRLHRVDGPAILETRLFGQREEYYVAGKPHRTDGPALIWRSDDGYERLEYYDHGRRHREDGPAVIMLKNSQVIHEQFWLNDRLVEKEAVAIAKQNILARGRQNHIITHLPH